MPLPHPSLPHGLLYLGCEYEADAVDFKVFVTQPNAPLFVDLAMAGRQHTKVGRMQYNSAQYNTVPCNQWIMTHCIAVQLDLIHGS